MLGPFSLGGLRNVDSCSAGFLVEQMRTLEVDGALRLAPPSKFPHSKRKMADAPVEFLGHDTLESTRPR